MAYPTPSDILNLLPGEMDEDFEAEVALAISSWKAKVAEAAGVSAAPENDPVAEDIVREGAYGRSYKRMLILDGRTQTPAADEIIKDANAALAAYDKRRAVEGEPGRVNAGLVSNVAGREFFDSFGSRYGFPSAGLSDHIDDSW